MERNSKKTILFLAVSAALAAICIFYLHDTRFPYRVLFLIVFLIVFICTGMAALLKIKPKIIMTILLVFFAGAFFFATPNGSMHDESVHFYRAFQVSQGQLVSIKIEGEGGGELPAGITEFTDSEAELDMEQTEQIQFPSAALYAPVAYIPQAVAIRIARLFTSNVSTIFTCGRLGVLISSLFLAILAIWKMPWGAELLFLIMMFPMTVQEYGNMTADGMTLSLSFAFTAWILNLAYSDRKCRVWEMVILTIMGMWISLIKISCYLPLTLLVLMIPKERFSGKKQSVLFKVILIASSVLITAGWLAAASGFASQGQRGDMFGQALYMASNIPSFLAAILRSFHFVSDFYVGTMIGSNLGALSVKTSTFMWVGFLILLIYQTAACKSTPDNPHKHDRLLYLVTFAACMLLVFAGLYAQWTAEIGYPVVEGVQGRYFTPVILLPLLVLAYSQGEGRKFEGSYYFMLIVFFNSIAVMDLMRVFAF